MQARPLGWHCTPARAGHGVTNQSRPRCLTGHAVPCRRPIRVTESDSQPQSESVSHSLESVSQSIRVLRQSGRKRLAFLTATLDGWARAAPPGPTFRGSGRGPSPSLTLRRRLAACACRLPPQPLIRQGILRLATRWPGRAAAARVRVARRRAHPPPAAPHAIPDQRGPTATLLSQRAASKG